MRHSAGSRAALRRRPTPKLRFNHQPRLIIEVSMQASFTQKGFKDDISAANSRLRVYSFDLRRGVEYRGKKLRANKYNDDIYKKNKKADNDTASYPISRMALPNPLP